MPDPELVAALSRLLSPLPGVSVKKTETHASFLVGKKCLPLHGVAARVV